MARNRRVLVLPENTAGRDFVVGDIHGAFDLLDEALAEVGFDPSKDRLIAVGDLIDRGPRSPDCLYYLAQPWFYALRGNHESLFTHLFREGILKTSGVTDKKSKAGMSWVLQETDETLEKIYNALKELPIAIEVETAQGRIGFVHGDVPAGIDWDTFRQKLEGDDQDAKRCAVWSRVRIESEDASGVDGVLRVFLGHTPVEGAPKMLGNCFFIDTGGVFKMMRPDNPGDYFQTLVEILANADDITHPVAAKNNTLVRTATVKKTKSPPPAP